MQCNECNTTINLWIGWYTGVLKLTWNRRLWVSFDFSCQFVLSWPQHFCYLFLNDHHDRGKKNISLWLQSLLIYACFKRFCILHCAVNVSYSIVNACKSNWCVNNTHPHNNQPYTLNQWREKLYVSYNFTSTAKLVNLKTSKTKCCIRTCENVLAIFLVLAFCNIIRPLNAKYSRDS